MGDVIRLIGDQAGVVEFPDINPGIQMVLEDVLLQAQFKMARLAAATDTSEALSTFQNLNTLTK